MSAFHRGADRFFHGLELFNPPLSSGLKIFFARVDQFIRRWLRAFRSERHVHGKEQAAKKETQELLHGAIFEAGGAMASDLARRVSAAWISESVKLVSLYRRLKTVRAETRSLLACALTPSGTWQGRRSAMGMWIAVRFVFQLQMIGAPL
jgi:hypothetical protein